MIKLTEKEMDIIECLFFEEYNVDWYEENYTRIIKLWKKFCTT